MKKTAFITALSAMLLLAGCTGDPAVTAETTVRTAENTTMAGTTTTTPAPSTETSVSDTEITTPDFTASVKENDYSAKALTKEEFGEIKKCYNQVRCDDAVFTALTDDGNIVTWGNNYFGRIGNGSLYCESENTEPTTCNPFLIDFSETVTDIECSQNMTYALTASGKMYTWGYNTFCRSGIQGENLSNPVLINTGFKIEKIFPGKASTLFLSQDQKLYISGVDIFEYKTIDEMNLNVTYEYNPETSEKPYPLIDTKDGYREIELPFICKDICAEIMYHAYLSEDGEVYIKGTVLRDAFNISSDFRIDELTKIDFPEKITDIEGSPSFVAALSESGKIYLYGNKESVFFDEKTDSEISDKIFRKGNTENFVFINSNSNFLAAVDSDGYAWCCGLDRFGAIYKQNGDDDPSSYDMVSGLYKLDYSDVKEIEINLSNVTVTLNNEQVLIQGNNSANQITYLNFDTMPDEE